MEKSKHPSVVQGDPTPTQEVRLEEVREVLRRQAGKLSLTSGPAARGCSQATQGRGEDFPSKR